MSISIDLAITLIVGVIFGVVIVWQQYRITRLTAQVEILSELADPLLDPKDREMGIQRLKDLRH